MQTRDVKRLWYAYKVYENKAQKHEHSNRVGSAVAHLPKVLSYTTYSSELAL